MADYDGSTALLIVDVQNDFADPGGSLYVRGGEEVVPFVNEQIRASEAAGAYIVYTQDWHPASTPHFQKDGGIWPVHCVGGEWGSAFHPDLLVVEAPRIRKGAGGEDGYSAFSVRNPNTGEVAPTQLEAILRARGISRLVIAGLATDYCVKETVLDSARLGLPATVLTAGIRAVDLEPGDGDRAIDAMRAAGAELI